MLLRAVFILSLAVVAVTHAVLVALLSGAALLLLGSPWVHEARRRWQQARHRPWRGRMDHGAFV
jgi:hypothetical protein